MSNILNRVSHSGLHNDNLAAYQDLDGFCRQSPLNFVKTRWNSLLAATERFVKIWPQLLKDDDLENFKYLTTIRGPLCFVQKSIVKDSVDLEKAEKYLHFMLTKLSTRKYQITAAFIDSLRL